MKEDGVNGSRSRYARFFFEPSDVAHRGLYQTLNANFPNCFTVSKRKQLSFTQEVQKAANAERNMQLMARSIADGVLSERDRLFEYTTGEYFQEMSLFIQEVETHNAEMEKIYGKAK